MVQRPGPNSISFWVLAAKGLIESPGQKPDERENAVMRDFFFLLTDTVLGIQDYIDLGSDIKRFNVSAK